MEEDIDYRKVIDYVTDGSIIYELIENTPSHIENFIIIRNSANDTVQIAQIIR